MTSPTDGVYLAPDLDEQAQSRALLREVITWGRSQGWRRNALNRGFNPLASWLRGERDFLGIPEEFVHIAEAGDRSNITGMSLFTQQCDGLKLHSVREAVDVLTALGVLPAPFSSRYRAGYDDGHADGCGAVTDISLMNLLDIELDKLDEPDRKAELRRKIEGWLPDDPYRSRLAVDEIVTAVWEVMEHRS